MAVDIQIPQVFRRHTNGARTVQTVPGTVREVLAALGREYPAFCGQMLTPEGSMHRFINLYVNQEDVRFLEDLETPVRDGDVVTILPAVAGGLPAVAGGRSGAPGRGRPRRGDVTSGMRAAPREERPARWGRQ